MNPFVVRPANPQDFKAIARLIAVQSKDPATHCIQGDTASDDRDIENEIVRLTLQGELCFMAAFENGALIGAMGCELDPQLGRGWTRGPFVLTSSNDWEQVASALFDGLLNTIPAAIHLLDSFLNIENQRGNQFYLAHAFQQLRLVHVYIADAPENPQADFTASQPLSPAQAQTFAALHDRVFPNTYATGQRILEKLDEEHRVFVCTLDDSLQGYVYAAIDEDTGNGSIEFIGVDDRARGKGLGRQLLQTALHWLIEVKKVPQTNLVVNDDLANARGLYESVGFHLKYTGVHTRKELTSV